MKSATADTNIYISAFEFGGPPRHFIELVANGVFRLDFSDAILREILRVLNSKFHWTAQALRELQDDIQSYANHIAPKVKIEAIKTDPTDNRILECALAAKSDFIVTGDVRHVLPLGSYAVIPIVKVADFLELLKLDDMF